MKFSVKPVVMRVWKAPRWPAWMLEGVPFAKEAKDCVFTVEIESPPMLL